MHVRVVVVRGQHRRGWRGHRQGVALGVRRVRPGQAVRGVPGGQRGVGVAPPGRGPGRRVDMAAAFGRGRRWRLVELDGNVAGGLRRAAASLGRRPRRFRVQELAAVVAAVGQAGAVERGVGAVHLLLCVALHEQVDGQHTCALSSQKQGGGVKIHTRGLWRAIYKANLIIDYDYYSS